MKAQISGSQRKVFGSSVRPARPSDGAAGITLRGGRSTPFVVTRSWSAPAGTYDEAWYLIDPQTREVLYEHVTANVSIWGLQGLTELTSEVRERLRLAAGPVRIVFALGGIMGGEVDLEVTDAPTEAAA